MPHRQAIDLKAGDLGSGRILVPYFGSNVPLIVGYNSVVHADWLIDLVEHKLSFKLHNG